MKKRTAVTLALISSLALLAFLGAWISAAEKDDDAEDAVEIERAIDLDGLPEAARTTIEREAGDHAIQELEEVHSGDRLYYEAEWIDGELEVEIAVSPEGKILNRETEPRDTDDED